MLNGGALWGVHCPKSLFPFPKMWLEFLHFEESYISDSSVSNWKHFTADCLTGSTKYVTGFTASLFPCLLWPQLVPFSAVSPTQTDCFNQKYVNLQAQGPALVTTHTHTDISKRYLETNTYVNKLHVALETLHSEAFSLTINRRLKPQKKICQSRSILLTFANQKSQVLSVFVPAFQSKTLLHISTLKRNCSQTFLHSPFETQMWLCPLI